VLRKFVPVGLAVALCACGDDSHTRGDLANLPPSEPSVLGGGARLSDLNDPDKPRPAENADVGVTGAIVVAVDSYDETETGSAAGNIYIQDLTPEGPPLPYGGITLFGASFNPPSLRVSAGDVIDVRGAYTEFRGPPSFPFNSEDPDCLSTPPEDCASLPEIVGGSISLRFEHRPPEPVLLEDLGDLASYATGRKWIGILVRVENVVAKQGLYCGSAPPDGSDPCRLPRRQSVRLDVPDAESSALPTITNALFDLASSGHAMGTGTRFESIVGVVQYFFNFSISPRSPKDIVIAQ
jgi:hypothetical protein